MAPWLHDIVAEVSHENQTPPDLAAMSIIGAAGARAYRVCIRERGFTEQMNIWTAILMPPGARKSSVYSFALRSVSEAEELLGEQMPPLARKRLAKKF